MAHSFPGASYDAWKTTEPEQLESPNCGDEHSECAPRCVYCSAPASIESAIGLDGDYDDQRRYVAPRAEQRCEKCHEGFIKSERRTRLLAEEGWI